MDSNLLVLYYRAIKILILIILKSNTYLSYNLIALYYF
jgi:hypothetical protein